MGNIQPVFDRGMNGNWFNNVQQQRRAGDKWESVPQDYNVGRELFWNDKIARPQLNDHFSSGWTTSPLQGARNWGYNVYPEWNYKFNWTPSEPKHDIYVKAQPIINQSFQKQKFVDDFQFPAWQPVPRAPLPEADWSIDRRQFVSNNPSKLFVSTDGVWATNNDNAQIPQLYTGFIGGWSGVIRGDLDNINYH